MPQSHKVLGQSNPSATTLTTLYTVPASTQAVCSTITICNTASTATTYRIAVRPAGASIATSQYLAYDAALPANDTATLTLGMTLAATDVVSVYAASANVAFSAFGVEIT
jgi:glucose-6-phosphate dehydrogenase assembly protein OpcA